jgi:orotate phosphoribosyltransferase
MKEWRSSLEVLESVNAVLTHDHFVYTSWKHGSAYVNKDAIYPHTRAVAYLCDCLAANFIMDDVQVVIGPEKGGIILSQWTAHHLTRRTFTEVLAIYAEKEADQFLVERGYAKLISGKNVLVVDDVLRTGDTIQKVVEVARRHGGNVVGIGVICDQGYAAATELGDPARFPKVVVLTQVVLRTWTEKECPLCKADFPPVNPNFGKGKEFLARYTNPKV